MAARHLLIGALASVLAMSACASDESSGSIPPSDSAMLATASSVPATVSTDVPTTTTPAPSTTATPETSPSTTIAVPETSASAPTTAEATTTTTPDASTTTSPPRAGVEIDLAAASLGGYTLLSPASALLDEFTDALGAPAVDSDWQPMPPRLICTGATEFRDLAWGDLRVVLERSNADPTPKIGSWVLGDRDTISPPRTADSSGEPTGVTTTEGVGIGSSPDEITTAELTPIDDGFVVINPAPVIIDVADGRITDLAVGRLDCLDPALSRVPCDTPIPIPLLPDGTAPVPSALDGDTVVWTAPADGPDAPSVTQRFDPPSADELANAADSPIGARIDPLDVRAVPVGDPPLGGSTFYVFDDRSDCVRVLQVGAGLNVDELGNYALFLADRLTPRR